MVCCMDSLNVLFLVCKRFKTQLHWLPVDKRIEYKLLLYTYKTLRGLAPGYLCKLVVPYEPRRVLRSAESNLVRVPPGKPGKYGSRSFVRASANLWNSLRGEMAAWRKNSVPVKSFKRNLKTYLFCERFLKLGSATYLF